MNRFHQQPTVVSLFSGAGGMDLGFSDAGFDIVWANDIDSDSCQTYRANNGSHIVCGDIRAIPIDEIPRPDVVIGGPPCQGFSVAGKMNPSDPRSDLVWEFVRVVRALRPRFFVMENVKALATLSKWSSLRSALLAAFRDAGYLADARVLNAADYGVPQQRERAIFIGSLGTQEHPRRPQATHVGKWVSAGEAIRGLPSPGLPGNEGRCVAKIVFASRPILRRSPFAGMLFNGQGRPIDLERPAPTMHASAGGNKTPIIDEQQLQHGTRPWVEKYHSGLMEGASAKGGYATEQLRRLTVREAARIQTFPDTFRFTGRQSSQFRQIGNAVPPRLAYAIAICVKDALREASTAKGEMSYVHPKHWGHFSDLASAPH